MYTCYFIIFIKILIKISQVMLERTLTALNAHNRPHLLYKLATSPGVQDSKKMSLRQSEKQLHIYMQGRIYRVGRVGRDPP
jgi:hypothetical protein